MTALTTRLDRLLGRITMYRLVLAWLGLLLLAALGLTLAGALAFGPLDLLLSLAVALAASYLANRLLALAFRLTPHSESTLITAALLVMIFQPTSTGSGLLALAAASVLAVASKYLLAVRGRHVVNPAAFGALLVGILGLDFSVWWVATPPLLPLVLIGALAILFRTRRLPLGLVFVGVATALISARLVSSGTGALEALGTALTSYPILFVAGFMLSEPLTLPPRRWQQLLVALVVGVLIAIPFGIPGPTLGPLTLGLFSTPELALVLGNVLAFALGRRRALRLDYRGKRRLTPTSWEFEFAPHGPVRFAPGQYLELTVPHRGADSRGLRRTFSIASAPGADETVRLGLRVPPERSSSYKQALLELEPGTRLHGTGVGGDFLLPRDPDIPLLLVAGGIGVTPFVSQLAAGPRRDVVLVYAVSSTDEIAYAVELAQSGCRVLLVSPDELIRMPEGWSRLDADRLTADSLLAAVPDAARRRVYLSGPPSMIGALRPALRRAGVRRVRTDAFLGY